MPDWSFDATNLLIVEPTSTGDTEYDVERDIYSAWKRQVALGALSGALPAFSLEGGTPIGSTGRFTGKTQVLINGWKLRGASYPHQVTLSGNIYSDDGVVVSPNTTASVSFSFEQSSAAQGIATGSAVTGQDLVDITNSVWQRVIETGLPAEEAMRIILAGTSGRINDLGSDSYEMMAPDGTTRRILGQRVANSRTTTLTP